MNLGDVVAFFFGAVPAVFLLVISLRFIAKVKKACAIILLIASFEIFMFFIAIFLRSTFDFKDVVPDWIMIGLIITAFPCLVTGVYLLSKDYLKAIEQKDTIDDIKGISPNNK